MERFYIPPTPQPRRRPRGGVSAAYQFRQPQTQVNPLALRRLQLQDVLSQRREEEAAGRQELEAMKEMARLEQQEYAIRQQITTQRQVASAQREVAQLDPQSPDFIQSYSDVMSRHPYAVKDKFLNEAFTHGAEVSQSVLKAILTDASEAFKTKEHVSEAEAKDHLKLFGEATAKGIDVEQFRGKDGEYHFNEIRSTVANRNAEVQKNIDTAMRAMTPHSVVIGSDGKSRATYESAKIIPDVVTTTTKPAALPGDPPIITTSTKHVVPASDAPQSKPGEQVGPPPEMFQGKPSSGFTDPDHVRNEYKAGRLTRDQAMTVLKDQFGHTD